MHMEALARAREHAGGSRAYSNVPLTGGKGAWRGKVGEGRVS